jgi:hypothetical protein
MLKPAEPTPPPERPIGELVQELVDEGKAYARAELDLGKAIATTKAKALALPAGLLVAALFIGMAAINALVFGVVLALAKFVGPLLGGLIGMLLFFALAGAIAWYAVHRIRRAL